MDKIKTHLIKDWNAFGPLINEIRQKYGSHKIEDHKFQNQILFRGQSNSEWPLTTTLERISKRLWTIRSYCETVLRCAPEIQSFTNKDWKLMKYLELGEKLRDGFQLDIPEIPMQMYEYMVYLRHHSFPSPLLDWTTSPYIAVFFALADKHNYERCSVFVYIETPKGMKYYGGGEGVQINVLGPYVKTHKRHFLQKAWYTIATSPNIETNEHEFVMHDKVFDTGNQHPTYEQDVLLKIEISTSLRTEILDYLDDYNINYFSLVQSEDSLMKNLARREIEE